MSDNQTGWRSYFVPFLIAICALAAFGLNAVGLSRGITDVLPHMFYVPIILVAYFYPRRGVIFAAVVSLMYLGLAAAATASATIILAALERGIIFIVIASVVAYLSYRLQQDAMKCLRFAAVVQSSTDAIVGKTLDGIVTDWNAAAEQLYGYTAEEMIGRSTSTIVPPDLGDETGTLLQKIREGKTVERYETGRVTKDGRRIVVSLSLSPIFDEHGRITGASTIAHDITRQKHAADEILRAKKEWELTFDAVPDMIAIIDRDSRIVRINRPMANRLGIRQEDAAGQPCYVIVHHADAPPGICPHQGLLSDGKSHTGEVHEDALGADFLVTVSPLTDPSGEVTGSVHVMQDVTESRRAEKALRDSNRRLADIIDFLPDPTFVIDRDRKVVAWNRAIELMSGVTAARMIGKGEHAYTEWLYRTRRPILIDYVIDRDIAGIRKEYPTCIIDGDIVRTESKITRQDGTVVSLWVTATPLYDPQGEVSGAIESLRDVTDVKRIQRALRDSKKYLDKIINTIADPVFVKDRNFRFVLLNDAFCAFTGHSREEFMGRTDYDVFRKEEADIFREKDEAVFREKREDENEEELTDALGVRHTIITKKTLYADTSGAESIVGIIRDVTTRKQIELALAQANQKLNILSSITRHDILNQLTGLRTYLELSRDLATDPQLLRFIEKEAETAEAISRQIEFTKYYQDIGVKAPAWYDVGRAIRISASQLSLGSIVLENTVEGIEIYADGLIEKVFYNLLENSIRHGKNVTRIRLSMHETEAGLAIVYEDDGGGISAEDKTRLFTKGFGKHTGLGLFLSREILAITRITIAENGTPGTGVRFGIAVPKDGYRFIVGQTPV